MLEVHMPQGVEVQVLSWAQSLKNPARGFFFARLCPGEDLKSLSVSHGAKRVRYETCTGPIGTKTSFQAIEPLRRY